jgi:hypothetical protein
MRRAGVVLLLSLVVACDRRPADPGWAAGVAARHAEADRLLDGADPQGARRVLASVLDGAPSGERAGDRALLQDTHFRLARLALAAGDAAGAVRQAEAGLALGDRGDLFAANLLIVRGAAREKLRDAPGAAADYERALHINEALLRDTLPAPSK